MVNISLPPELAALLPNPDECDHQWTKVTPRNGGSATICFKCGAAQISEGEKIIRRNLRSKWERYERG